MRSYFLNSESDMRHYEEIEFKKGQARMSGQAVSNGEIVTSNTLPRTGQKKLLISIINAVISFIFII